MNAALNSLINHYMYDLKAKFTFRNMLQPMGVTCKMLRMDQSPHLPISLPASCHNF